MRIMHTSDWHLGKTIHGQDLLGDQRFVLDRIAEEVENGYDGLIISGDIYDRSVPPSEAVELLGQFLERMSSSEIEAVLIPGNHDSPTRLSFASGVLDRGGIHLRCSMRSALEPVIMSDGEGGELHVYGLPFVEESQVKIDYPGNGVRTHEEAVRFMVSEIRRKRIEGVRSILVAHEYTGGNVIKSDSERELLLGNQGRVDPSVFQGFDYVALGHLHRPQCASVAANAFYAGSIMPYSFSEADHVKSVTSLEFGREGLKRDEIPINLRRDFNVIEGRFDDILYSDAYEGLRDDYVSVRLLDEAPLMNIQSRLKNRFPFLLEIVQRALSFDEEVESSRIRAALDHPRDLFTLFLDSFGWDDPEKRSRAMDLFDSVRRETEKERREVKG